MGCLDISGMHESTFYEFCLEPLLFQQFIPFLTPKIMPMAHKACSKALKVVRMTMISFNVFCIALKATGKTLLVGVKQV